MDPGFRRDDVIIDTALRRHTAFVRRTIISA
jgi:hypothetical protein